MRRVTVRGTAAAAVVASLIGLAGCQPQGAFFAEVRTDGVQASAGWTPVAGDLDGDGHDDVLWHDDDRPDQLWRGRGDGTFTKVAAPADQGAGFHPIVGDFSGGPADDVLWYGGAFPAYSDTSEVWIMAEDRSAPDVVEVAIPFDADRSRPALVPDADSRDGVAFARRFGDVVVWDADDPHGGAAVAIPYDETWGSSAQPYAGDFDGDGAGDVYVTGYGAPGAVAWSDGAGGFTTTATRTIQGYHEINVLHLNHDTAADITFTGGGNGFPIQPVNVWFGGAHRTFARQTLPAFPHGGRAEVHADTTFAGADALVRYGDDRVTALRFTTNGKASFTPSNTVALGPWNQSTRVIGEFGDGGSEDVLVYRNGSGSENLLLTPGGQD